MKKKRTPAKKDATVKILWREEETTEEAAERVQTKGVRELGNAVTVPLAFLADLPEDTIQLPDFPIQAQGTGISFYVHCEEGYKFVVRGMTPQQQKLLYG